MCTTAGVLSIVFFRANCGSATASLVSGPLPPELVGFQMDFANLVVTQDIGGLPTLINAGTERFRGFEAEGTVRLHAHLHARAAYSLHDARFRDSVQDFGGVATQLAGNRLEMSARNMASAGFVWAPPRKWFGSISADYVGSRLLDKRNRSTTDPYVEWDAGFGYRLAVGEVRLDGRNLGNTRPPVSESELGDAQYYRLPARTVQVSWISRW